MLHHASCLMSYLVSLVGSSGCKKSEPGVIAPCWHVSGPDGTADSPVGCTAMFVINAGHVVVDNTWLWRADHAG